MDGAGIHAGAGARDPRLLGRPGHRRATVRPHVQGRRATSWRSALETMSPHGLMRAAFDTIDLIADVPPCGRPASPTSPSRTRRPRSRAGPRCASAHPPNWSRAPPHSRRSCSAARPGVGPARLVHGDYHPGNLVFRGRRRGRRPRLGDRAPGRHPIGQGGSVHARDPQAVR